LHDFDALDAKDARETIDGKLGIHGAVVSTITTIRYASPTGVELFTVKVTEGDGKVKITGLSRAIRAVLVADAAREEAIATEAREEAPDAPAAVVVADVAPESAAAPEEVIVISAAASPPKNTWVYSHKASKQAGTKAWASPLYADRSIAVERGRKGRDWVLRLSGDVIDTRLVVSDASYPRIPFAEIHDFIRGHQKRRLAS